MSMLVSKQVERKSMRVNLAVQKLSHGAKSFYSDRANKILNLANKISTLTQDKIVRADFRLEKAMNSLDNLSPLKTLQRGYFALSVADKSITSVRGLKEGDIIKGQGADGTFESRVTSVEIGEQK